MNNLWKQKYLRSCLSDKHHWDKLHNTNKDLICSQQYEDNDGRYFSRNGSATNSASCNIDLWNNIDQCLLQRGSKDVTSTIMTTHWEPRNLYHLLNRSQSTRWLTHPDTYTTEKAHRAQTLKPEQKNTFLLNIREYLAKYQEIYGTPRTEYSFTALVCAMGQATGQSLLALFYILINLAPIAEVFLYILRFLLDKAINIQNSDNFHQSIIKYIIFAVQLIGVYACLMFIFGFILLPILDMLLDIVAKILLYN